MLVGTSPGGSRGQRGAVVGAVHSPGAARGAATSLRSAPLQDWHQAYVGGSRQRQWWKMG